MFRLIIRWIMFASVLIFISKIIPGIIIDNFAVALWVAFAIGIVNIFIKPILVILTLPVNLVTLAMLIFILNILLFWVFANYVTGFAVTGVLEVFLGGLLMSVISFFINVLDL